MTDHLVRYGVILNEANVDPDSPSLIFDCISGVGPGGVYSTETRNIEPGTRIASLKSIPDTFDQTIKLYEVTAEGLNLLDDQPVTGDTMMCVCPPSDLVFQAGMNAVFVGDDGHVATIGIGLLLTLFPLFAQDWLARVPNLLNEALGSLDVPGQVQQALAGLNTGGVRLINASGLVSPETLAGENHTVVTPGPNGMVDYEVSTGDTVAVIIGSPDNFEGSAVVELRTVTALPADGEDPTPWPLLDRQVKTGDLFLQVGPAASPDSVGQLAVAIADGVATPVHMRTIIKLFTEIDGLRQQIAGLAQPQPDPEPVDPGVFEIGTLNVGSTPSHVTPMTDWAWDGTDNVLVSADTSNQPILVSVPPAEGDVINSTLIVHNRNGANDVTVGIHAAEDHQGDIVVPPGHVATIRAIFESYVLTTWL